MSFPFLPRANDFLENLDQSSKLFAFLEKLGLVKRDPPPPTIVDIVLDISGSEGLDSNGGDFDILREALVAADLVETLADRKADFSVFAPTDAAFIKLAQDLGADVADGDEEGALNAILGALADLNDGDAIPLLKDILLYHVAPDGRTLAELQADGTITTAQGGTFDVDGTTLVDAEPAITDPSIVGEDIEAANGTIQVIDRVLLPIDIPGVDLPNIVDIASGSDDFNILVKALGAAALVETVRGLDDVTVFAPTDAAFTQLAVDLGFEGEQSDEDAVFAFIAGALGGLAPDGDPIPLLTDILFYHVSAGAKSADEIDALDTVDTFLTGETFGSEGTELVDNEPDIANPNIVIPDIAAGNGTIQAIDRVLLPIDIPGNDLPNIVDIAAGSDDFNILVKALETATLDDDVRNSDDITVFAPTDAAFTQLALDLGYGGDESDEEAVFGFIADTLASLDPNGDPIPLLTDILLYHVSPGAKSADEVDAADEVTTLLTGATFGSEGTELVDNEPDIANPNIVIPDIPADNGTIQAIDRVLLPIDIPGNTPSIVDIATGSDDFNILVKALMAANLVDAINMSDGITVFAPTDAAFTQLALDLGFDGDAADEDAVFGFIAGALAGLAPDGNPIPLLTDILLYHVSPDELSSDDLGGKVSTLLGAEIVPSKGQLVDLDPSTENPEIVIPDIKASNGTIQVIDRVLLPVDIDGVGKVLVGEDGRDRLIGSRDDDEIFGFDGNDMLRGRKGDDLIDGGEGNDHIFGGRGDDELHGGEGNDKLLGGFGNDVLSAGAGRDLLFGGFGNDTFVFDTIEGHNKIFDFRASSETIEISGEFASFAELQDASTSGFLGTTIEGENGNIFLAGVRMSQLDEDNFILS